MKVAILAGGLGTRLAEETEVRPKPMVEIGGRPILWHIMRHFDHYGFREFAVALGYKGDYIKSYFSNYHSLSHSMRVSLRTGDVTVYDDGVTEDWTLDLVETGRDTQTGGRIKRLVEHMGGTFFLTWGDAVSDVDLDALLSYHRSHRKLVTVVAVHPPPRFGQLVLENGNVVDFTEKPLDQGWVNGGIFVCEPDVGDFIEGDSTHWEKEPMEKLAAEGELMAFRHEGFWQPMDTMREKVVLQHLWDTGAPPWRIWE